MSAMVLKRCDAWGVDEEAEEAGGNVSYGTSWKKVFRLLPRW